MGENRKENAKSAPLLGRKRNEKKMSSLREIELWVNQGNQKEITSRTSARNVGLLTENVTEDIMLYARQCELGRERYKFLANHAYERQKFIEKQNKKEKSMKKQMIQARRSIERIIPPPESRRKSLTVRIPQVDQTEAAALDEVDGPDDVFETEVRSPTRAGVTSAKELNIVLNSNAEKEVHLPKTITLDKKKSRGTYLNTGLRSAKQQNQQSSDVKDVEKSSKDRDRLPNVRASVCKAVSYGDRPDSVKSLKSEKTGVTRASKTASSSRVVDKRKDSVMDTARKSIDISDGPVNIWASKSRYARMKLYGHRFASSVDDPRYIALTASLIPHNNVLTRSKSDVGDIIARKDALRKRSRCEGDYTKRLHARFIAQILQHELSATM